MVLWLSGEKKEKRKKLEKTLRMEKSKTPDLYDSTFALLREHALIYCMVRIMLKGERNNDIRK